MAASDSADLVLEHVGRAALPLYEGVTIAFSQAEAKWSSMPGHESSRYLLSHMTRLYARAHWSSELPPGWRLSGNPALGGQLFLIQDEAGLRLRLRKENRSVNPGGVPAAGKTRAQQQCWGQGAFDLEMPNPRPHSPEGYIELLLLMDWVSSASGWQVTSRVVHPIEVGEFGRSVAFDFSLDLTPGSDMWGKLQFLGDAEIEDFFADEGRENGTDLDGTDGGR